MTERDFLNHDPTQAPAPNLTEQNLLLGAQQVDHLAEIAMYLRRQNADVLASAVVKGTSQLSNAISDTKSHEVMFEVGGKPVTIYRLLAFSTWWTGAAARTIGLSVLSLSKVGDGYPLITNGLLNLTIPLSSVHVMSADATIANPLIVNGPADATLGGLFIYGFTVPDWDRIRGSIRR